MAPPSHCPFFFFNDTATTEIYTLSLHDALPIYPLRRLPHADDRSACVAAVSTSERVRNLITRAQDDWLIAVQDSLVRNRGTLAVQSMDRLLGENGALAALRAKGYLVEGP